MGGWVVGWLDGWLTCGPIGGVETLANGPRGSARVRRELLMANRVLFSGFLEKGARVWRELINRVLYRS